MKQQMVAIEYNSVHEMRAIRAVLVDFGYKIFHAFEDANTTGGRDWDHVLIDRYDASRGTYRVGSSYTKLTLQQFIAREQSSSTEEQHRKQAKIAEIEGTLASLNRQLAELKASI